METQKHFKVDTRRHHSRSKLQAQWRHVFGIMTFMFPLGALFIFLMSFLQDSLHRGKLHLACIGCLVGGVVSSLLWGILVAIKNRRHAATHREREAHRQERAAELQRERDRLAAQASATTPAAPDAENGPRP